MKYCSLLFVSFLILSGTLLAQGGHGDGLFLMKIEHNAHATGMGTAVVSLKSNVNLAGYNPAGIVGIDKSYFSFGHNEYWENIKLETGTFAKNINDKWYYQTSVRYASVNNLELRNSPSSVPDGYFEAYDMSFKGGLAYRLSDKLSAGISCGWFIEKIGAYRGSTFNVDLGVINSVNENITIGGAVTNLGRHFRLSLEGDIESNYITLPTTYQFGGSYRYDKYLGAVDFVYLDDELKIHFGGEAEVHEYLKLRAGYMTNYSSKNLTAGLAFYYRNIVVDYGFLPFKNNLGTSHSFNLTFSL